MKRQLWTDEKAQDALDKWRCNRDFIGKQFTPNYRTISWLIQDAAFTTASRTFDFNNTHVEVSDCWNGLRQIIKDNPTYMVSNSRGTNINDRLNDSPPKNISLHEYRIVIKLDQQIEFRLNHHNYIDRVFCRIAADGYDTALPLYHDMHVEEVPEQARRLNQVLQELKEWYYSDAILTAATIEHRQSFLKKRVDSFLSPFNAPDEEKRWHAKLDGPYTDMTYDLEIYYGRPEAIDVYKSRPFRWRLTLDEFEQQFSRIQQCFLDGLQYYNLYADINPIFDSSTLRSTNTHVVTDQETKAAV